MLRRSAFSRGEVLITLLGVALVSGLVVAAIARMQEAAARTRCQNNLKQLALGVLNYYDVAQKLPPLTFQGSAAPSGDDLRSPFAALGPYLEANVFLYRSAGSPADAYHAPSSVPFPVFGKEPDSVGIRHGGDANQIWPIFLDPADTTASAARDVAVTLPDGSIGYYATGSYAANGLLPWGRRTEAKAMADWSGVASFFAERPQVCRTATGEEVHNLWGVGFYSPNMPSFATLTPSEPAGLWSTGQVAPDVAQLIGSRGADPREMRVRLGRTDAPLQPADFSTPFQMLRAGQPCDPRRPATQHRGGMPAAMSDGSVRVFAPKVDPWVFWAACVLDDSRDGK